MVRVARGTCTYEAQKSTKSSLHGSHPYDTSTSDRKEKHTTDPKQTRETYDPTQLIASYYPLSTEEEKMLQRFSKGSACWWLTLSNIMTKRSNRAKGLPDARNSRCRIRSSTLRFSESSTITHNTVAAV